MGILQHRRVRCVGEGRADAGWLWSTNRPEELGEELHQGHRLVLEREGRAAARPRSCVPTPQFRVTSAAPMEHLTARARIADQNTIGILTISSQYTTRPARAAAEAYPRRLARVQHRDVGDRVRCSCAGFLVGDGRTAETLALTRLRRSKGPQPKTGPTEECTTVGVKTTSDKGGEPQPAPELPDVVRFQRLRPALLDQAQHQRA